nr:MAG TPA: hypothetical protein [Crassvirales sp.]
MLEKLLLYDNQQPRPLILLVIVVWVRFIDYPIWSTKSCEIFGKCGKLSYICFIIN